ncbi:hypothetical protein [Paenibacillus humicola]|uniref:hypothetical protein n=1 Tax=Paenibacillus humicola TaxID=3110540 RepID=UPI00237C12E0|nr:hypothetical protein [Paenibacillus humicola]
MNADLLKRITEANGRTPYTELDQYVEENAESIIQMLYSAQNLAKTVSPDIEPAPVFKSKAQ